MWDDKSSNVDHIAQRSGSPQHTGTQHCETSSCTFHYSEYYYLWLSKSYCSTCVQNAFFDCHLLFFRATRWWNEWGRVASQSSLLCRFHYVVVIFSSKKRRALFCDWLLVFNRPTTRLSRWLESVICGFGINNFLWGVDSICKRFETDLFTQFVNICVYLDKLSALVEFVQSPCWYWKKYWKMFDTSNDNDKKFPQFPSQPSMQRSVSAPAIAEHVRWSCQI